VSDAPAAPLRWGIIGPGTVATAFAGGLTRHAAGRIVATCGPPALAAPFAATHGGDVIDELEDLLRVPGLEAVFVAGPREDRRDAIDRCLREGVPVLAAAPMAVSARDTEWLVGLSGMTAAPLLEAWGYRTHPQWPRLLELVADGALGRVTRIAARAGAADPDDTGAGAIDTRGGEPVSAALAIASAALGRSVSELDPSIGGGGSRTPAGPDGDALAAIELGGAITATIAVSTTRDLGAEVRVQGDRAGATLDTPFHPDADRAVLRLENAAGEIHEEVFATTAGDAADADAAIAMAMARIVRGGLGAPIPAPLVDHAESIATASVLEAWRALVPPAAAPG
jgi:predicted dehydrogenase